jgi:hypothetical protein
VAGNNREFDGTTITVHIPMTWKRHGGRKVIIAPDGGDAWAPAKLRPDGAMIRALVRAADVVPAAYRKYGPSSPMRPGPLSTQMPAELAGTEKEMLPPPTSITPPLTASV